MPRSAAVVDAAHANKAGHPVARKTLSMKGARKSALPVEAVRRSREVSASREVAMLKKSKAKAATVAPTTTATPKKRKAADAEASASADSDAAPPAHERKKTRFRYAAEKAVKQQQRKKDQTLAKEAFARLVKAELHKLEQELQPIGSKPVHLSAQSLVTCQELLETVAEQVARGANDMASVPPTRVNRVDIGPDGKALPPKPPKRVAVNAAYILHAAEVRGW